MPLRFFLFASSFFICFLLTVKTSNCQDSTKDFFRKIDKQFAPAGYIYYPVPYKVKSVTIVDNRPDTTRIGLFEDKQDRDAALYLHPNETLQGLFDSLLTGRNSTANLKIVLNHFFITNPQLAGDGDYKGWIGYDYPCEITIQAKVYIQQGNYWQGLFKADTSIVIYKKLETSYRDLVYETGLYFSRKIKQAILENSFAHRPKLTEQLIDSINKTVGVVAIAEQDSVGIFKTFADFMAGKVTVANVNLEQVQKGIYYAYQTEKGETATLINNVWGVVKSGDVYIMRYNMAFPLVKVNNVYYWNEVYRYKNKGLWLPVIMPVGGGAYGGGFTQVTSKIKYLLKPCMLNMVTGDGH